MEFEARRSTCCIFPKGISTRTFVVSDASPYLTPFGQVDQEKSLIDLLKEYSVDYQVTSTKTSWARDLRLSFAGYTPRGGSLRVFSAEIAPPTLQPALTSINLDDYWEQGGNVIQAMNAENKLITVVGEDFFSNRAHYDGDPEWTLAAFADNLGIDAGDVLRIPQWIYHIDCMIAYLGNATFAVHCFRKTLENLDRLGLPGSCLPGVEQWALRFEMTGIVDRVCGLLEKAHFTVVRCPGVLSLLKNTTSLPPRGITADMKNLTDTVLFANFVNGVVGYTERGEAYYLVGTSPLPRANALFAEALQSVIKPERIHYLTPYLYGGLGELFYFKSKISPDYFGRATQETLIAGCLTGGKGGLRCQTNFLKIPPVK